MISSTECSAASTARTASDRTPRSVLSRKEAQYDIALVKRFNSGDERAFVEIMSRHRDRVFSVAYAMLKNHADAEEIVQDAFIRAHRGLVGFRGDSSLSTWMHRIAMNLSRNRYWYFFRRRRQSTVSLNLALGFDSEVAVGDLIPAEGPNPATGLVSSEFAEMVAGCMQKLTEDSRRILSLRNTLDWSYGEIARELGINIGTVKSRIARARKNLRILLHDCSPEFGLEDVPISWFATERNLSGSKFLAA